MTAMHLLTALPRASHFFRLPKSRSIQISLNYGSNLLTRNPTEKGNDGSGKMAQWIKCLLHSISLIPSCHVRKLGVEVCAGTPRVAEETGGPSGLLLAV